MNQVSVKIPGKVMLAGEYSVLFGGGALAATVKNQMDITVTSYTEGLCRLESRMWKVPVECPVGSAATLVAGEAGSECVYAPLLDVALSGMRKNKINGASISVGGNLKPEYGFGSSSALRLGTSVALKSLAKGSVAETFWEEAKDAFTLQKRSQTRASGYDIVTQYMGGLTLLKPSLSGETSHWPGRITVFPKAAIQRLNSIVHVFVGGKGAPTSETMAGTLGWLESKNLIADLVLASEQLITAFQLALQSKDADLTALIGAVVNHRQLFTMAPNFPFALYNELKNDRGFDQDFTFKTTGAGGEDAVLLIGREEHIKQPAAKLTAVGWRQIKRPFTQTGTTVDFAETGGDAL